MAGKPKKPLYTTVSMAEIVLWTQRVLLSRRKAEGDVPIALTHSFEPTSGAAQGSMEPQQKGQNNLHAFHRDACCGQSVV